MWTSLGYYDYGGEFCFSEAFHGARKLRPLVPRPLPSLRAQYYHLGSVLNEEGKRELNNNDDENSNNSCGAPVVVSSSRWNPTAEQLRILEELYRRGTRTPSADQIQHITAHLRRYGKIQGKNVFYWFQNHKARERQKRRRLTLTPAHQTTKHYSETEKGYEIQQTKKKCWWPPLPSPPSKNCTTSLSQECGKTQRTTKVEEEEVEEEKETIRRRRESVERDYCWRWNNNNNNNNTVNCQLMNRTRKTQHLKGDVEPETTTTLQLFPVRSSKREGQPQDDDDQLKMVSDSGSGSDKLMIKTKTSSSFSPTCTFQFFQFLPLKN